MNRSDELYAHALGVRLDSSWPPKKVNPAPVGSPEEDVERNMDALISELLGSRPYEAPFTEALYYCSRAKWAERALDRAYVALGGALAFAFLALLAVAPVWAAALSVLLALLMILAFQWIK
jgi:hypothetical protein